MRTQMLSALVCGLALWSSGCTVAWDVARTNVLEPAHYPTNIEHIRLCIQSRRAAEKVLQDLQAGGQAYSKDYHKGFKEGFADFLQYGGNGEPPSIPPRQYWNDDSLPGRDAAFEWSAGFRHGATMAQRSGLRELIVVPLTGPGISGGRPMGSEARHTTTCDWRFQTKPEAPTFPPLPAPRIIDRDDMR